MVYTGRGDEGETDLGSGESVEKDSKRIEAYGTVDELNSLVGLIASKSPEDIDEFEKI
ncbi:MAG: ATP:cob(I)alamin adenosyltransferase, partial [Candidatus Nanohaloarchaea archaeon]